MRADEHHPWPHRPDQPALFDVEYGTDGLLVDDATWVIRQTTAVSLWGHVFAAGAAH